METRVCLRCSEEKPIAEFHVDRKRPSGRRPYCKACRCDEERERQESIPPPTEHLCPKCGKVKPDNEFTVHADAYRKRGGRPRHCNSCNLEARQETKQRRKRSQKKVPWTRDKAARRALAWNRRKQHYLKVMGGQCSHCFISTADYPAAIFDFHHTDPFRKETNIGRLLGTKSRVSELEEQLRGCIILCSNCHRALHWKERWQSYQLQEEM